MRSWRALPALLAVLSLVPFQAALAGHSSSSSAGHSHGGGGSHHSSGGASAPHSSGGSVRVHGYTRKDGTYVAPYTRSSPRSGSTSHPSAHVTKTPVHPPKSTSSPPQTNGEHTKRSKAARDEFMREHPCPSTGRTSGACPGYVVDHVQALKHGGADAPSNMQWQTIENAKEKDKWE